MIVHVIVSNNGIKESLPYLQSAVEAIHDSGAVLSRDWIGAAKRHVEKSSEPDLSDTISDWNQFHQENLDSLSRADIVLADVTSYTFPDGFYTLYALEHKKPVLLVTRNDIRTCLLAGIQHKLLTTSHYDTKEDLKKIVTKFIKANTIATKDLRFNFFIDRQIYSYLREVSYETGKNKSEIIRELLEQEIDKQERA